jgi:hypothetical protein
MAADPPRPDVVLPLANGGNVRHVIGQRAEPFLLHATTSRRYTAELHRHVPHRDQCIACRFPETGEPVFECSTAPEPDPGDTGASEDAALPFLSATASLVLASALAQLPGPVMEANANHWVIHLELGSRVVQAVPYKCRSDCQSTPSRDVLQRVNNGRRWNGIGT